MTTAAGTPSRKTSTGLALNDRLFEVVRKGSSVPVYEIAGTSILRTEYAANPADLSRIAATKRRGSALWFGCEAVAGEPEELSFRGLQRCFSPFAVAFRVIAPSDWHRSRSLARLVSVRLGMSDLLPPDRRFVYLSDSEGVPFVAAVSKRLGTLDLFQARLIEARTQDTITAAAEWDPLFEGVRVEAAPCFPVVEDPGQVIRIAGVYV